VLLLELVPVVGVLMAGAAGAVVSTVYIIAADAEPTLPAKSVWLAVKL